MESDESDNSDIESDAWTEESEFEIVERFKKIALTREERKAGKVDSAHAHVCLNPATFPFSMHCPCL